MTDQAQKQMDVMRSVSWQLACMSGAEEHYPRFALTVERVGWNYEATVKAEGFTCVLQAEKTCHLHAALTNTLRSNRLL